MHQNTFSLLQKEGYLMQGCFKASLKGMLAGTNALPGPLYAAFFNYGIGMERLLKILLLLDNWCRNRKFLTNEQLRDKGHKIQKLYEEVLPLLKQYNVEWRTSYEPDEINKELLNFLSDFANGSRYYNLNAIADGTSQDERDPVYRWQRIFYKAYAQDQPGAQPVKSKPDVPEDEMSMSELTSHYLILAATRAHLCWRMVQLIIPLKELLIAIEEKIHADDFSFGGPDTEPTVPFMTEFLEFVGPNKESLQSEDWPYVD